MKCEFKIILKKKKHGCTVTVASIIYPAHPISHSNT